MTKIYFSDTIITMTYLEKIYKLLDLLKEEKQAYVLITMKGNKEKTKASIFHNIDNKENKLKMNYILNNVISELRKIK